MAIKPLPHPSVAMVDKEGRVVPVWYEYLKSREAVGLSSLPDVKLTALANGEVLIWNSTDGKYENGAN